MLLMRENARSLPRYVRRHTSLKLDMHEVVQRQKKRKISSAAGSLVGQKVDCSSHITKPKPNVANT